MTKDDASAFSKLSPERQEQVRAAIEASSDQPLSDDWWIRSIIACGRNALSQTPVFDHSHSEIGHSLAVLDSVVPAISADIASRPDLRAMVIGLLQAGFTIGAHAQGSELSKVLESRRQSEAGKRGAESRRDKAKAGWRTHATDLVREIRAEDVSLSNDAVSVEVANRWKSSEADCPTPRTVTKLVKELEANGTISPASKRK